MGCHFLLQGIRVQSLGWEDPTEKGMATHSSILAWRIPWTEVPGRLQPMRLQRVGHDFFIDYTPFWRRQWHPTPVLLPGKSHGWRSLVGCSPWGCLETTERFHSHFSLSTFMPWSRKWQPTPVFLPGESQGRRSLVGCSPWGC